MAKRHHEKKVPLDMAGKQFVVLLSKEQIRELSGAVPAIIRKSSVSLASESETINTLTSIATNAWRAKRKMVDIDTGEPKEEMKKVFRHVEAIIDSLTEFGLRIEDADGRQYDPGMALKVVAFEETPGILKDKIKETIRPSVLFKGSMIQMGEVIVGTPVKNS